MTNLIKYEAACRAIAECKAVDEVKTWADKAAYDAQARKLVEMFSKNFGQYVPYIDEDVKAAAIG